MDRRLLVGDIAALVGGSVIGSSTIEITGVATLEDAGPGDLVFVESALHERLVLDSRAGVVLAASDLPRPPHMACIVVRAPKLALVTVLDAIAPPTRTIVGVSAGAHIERDVRLGDGAGVGPAAWVGTGARVGARTEIHPGATVGPGVTIGDDCIIYPGAHIYAGVTIGNRVIVHSGAVIGADGFGYARAHVTDATMDDADAVIYRKIRHLGRVVIEDDVEIGANATIDRASLGMTRVGRGTKIDNLVMVGHNCTIGPHGILVGQVGLSGSVTLDHHVTIGGQAGVADHVSVGTGATIGAQAGVTHDIAAGATVLGSPAIDVSQARRALPLIKWLPELRKGLAELRRRLDALEGTSRARDVDPTTTRE